MQNRLCFPCKGTPAPLRITRDKTSDNQFDRVHNPNLCLLSALCTVKGYFYERSHWLTSLDSVQGNIEILTVITVKMTTLTYLSTIKLLTRVLGFGFCFTGRTKCRLHSWHSRQDRGAANHLVCFTETRHQKERALSHRQLLTQHTEESFNPNSN